MKVLEELRQDVAHAFRVLRKERGFATTVIVILALGIGAQTAVFSLVNGILLRPLEYRNPGRLYAIEEVIPEMTRFYPVLPVNAQHYIEWTKHCDSCQSIALTNTNDSNLNLTGRGEPQRVFGEKVTANYFSLLGMNAEVGRVFTSEDGQPGHEHIVVISDGLWHSKFGGNPSVLGQTVTLNNTVYTVVGVLPPSFRAPAWKALGIPMRTDVDVFQPWAINEKDWDPVGEFDFGAIVRLKPGVTEAQTRAELNLIEAHIASTLTGEDKVDFVVKLTPLQGIVTAQERGGLWLLLAAVGAVLLIVCVNLGNLMLTRALGRTRETAVRIALGASRGGVMRGILTECLLLAIVGGVLGIALAEMLVRVLVLWAPVDLPRLSDVHVDWRVLLFALGAAAACGLFFGLFPAWRLMRVDPQEAMRSGSRSTTESGSGMRVRELLVSVEVGLSCLLLIVAGLLLTSFARLLGVNSGFSVQHILTAEISPPAPRYKEQGKRRQLYRDILEKVRTEPGVVSAGLISVLPLSGQLWADVISVSGDTRPMMERPISAYRPITPGYFQTMGIRLIAGRDVSESDDPRSVALVSERTAQTVWPGQNAIGKQFRRGDPKAPPYEVIGVVADVRDKGLQEKPGLMVYVPYWEHTPGSAALAVRTAGDPTTAAGAIRAAVWSVDSQLPISNIQTMRQIESHSLSQRRFQIALLAIFAGSALLLAALGTYGVLAFSVARRTNEIGIRIALGAQRGDILSTVMRRGLAPVAAGVAAGIAGALALGKVLAGFLFSVKPYDPTIVIAVLIVTFATAAAACWLPARRATKVDPLNALRYE